jgi:uncharacterized repeat protein (TIGR02543 family)
MLGVIQVWGGSYTITFSTGSGDGTNASTSTAASTCTTTATYVDGNLATATKTYYSGSSGLKLGTGSAAGTIKINLSAAGQVVPSKVSVYAKYYSSKTKGAVKITTNLGGNNSSTTTTASFAEYSYSYTGSSALTYIQIDATKYIWVEKIVVIFPEVTASTTSISNLNYDYGSGPSSAQSFNVSGTNLGGNITITAPTNFQVCKTQNGTYTNSVSFTPSSGTVSSSAVYVRLAAGKAIGSYGGASTYVTVASSKATTKNVSVSGTVSAPPAACTATPTVGVAQLNGSFNLTQVPLTCSVTDEGGTGCSISAVGFVWKAGSDPIASDNPKAGTYSNGTITGSIPTSGSFAADGTTYYIKAYATNGAGTAVSSSSFQFTPRSVTFNLNGHGTSAPATQYVNNGGKATNPNYSENVTGYTFDSWYDNADWTQGTQWNFTSSTVSGGNKVLYAKWTPNKYAFAWNFNGGSTTSTTYTADNNQMPYGTPITYPSNESMSREGYDFNGWSSNATTMPDAILTITAQWTPKEYTITYKDKGEDVAYSGNNGSSLPDTHTYGTATNLVTGTKTGYTSTGWFTDKNCTVSAGSSIGATAITSNITLYTDWTENEYDIVYDKNTGGVGDGTEGHEKVKWSANVTLNSCGFTAPTDKYFLGWDKNPSATSPAYTAGSSYSKLTDENGATVTLYAIWEDYDYTDYRIICCTKHNIELAGDGTVTGGTFSSDKNRACENDPVVLTAVAATGYDFTSWDATYSDGEIKHATFVDATANPGTMNMPAYSATVTPTFTPITYNISYENMADASYTEGSNPTTYTIVSEDITLIAPVKDEYKFDGWFTDADLAVGHKVNGVAISTGTIGDKTFYAKWVEDNKWSVSITDPEHGTVTVKWNDGSEHSMSEGSEDILKDTEITIEVEGETGYELDELRINGELADPGTMDLTNNTTIAATFKLTTYNITYHLNGGSGAENTTYNYLSGKITLPAAPTVNKTGHTFLGWFATEGLTGSTVTEIAANSTGHKEYWASWSINSYQLTWALNGGTIKTAGTAAGEIVYNSDITAPVVEKEGYHFTGWSEDVPAKMPAEDKTYTAQWEINTYEVHWYVNDVEWTDKGGSETVEHGSTATLPTAPTKADGCGDKFMGWTTIEDYTGNGAPDPLYTTPPTITEDTDFYAVFADYGE